MGILDPDRISKLHAAVLSAGLVPSRETLLAGIDPPFTATLPRAPTPSDQILSDLHALNTFSAQTNGMPPFLAWLANAITPSQARAEVDIFSDALNCYRGSLCGTPALAQRAGPRGTVPQCWIQLATVAHMEHLVG